MRQYEKLDYMLEGQGGMIRTYQAVAEGISKPVFYEYVRDRCLERISRGIYLAKDSWLDSMYMFHLRFEQLVYSHETALLLHDLTDREPFNYSVTVKTGYNPSKMKAEGIQVYTVKTGFYDMGLTTAQTPFGHMVPVYDVERTICDLIRSRSKIEIQVFQGALRAYVRRADKNLQTLMKYAAQFRVEKVLRGYLEVLL